LTARVYTVGYIGRTMADIALILRETKGVLFDIRFSPHSRNPVWELSALRKRFGFRYRHVPAFGNKNYRSGPIEIADFEAGLQAIQKSGRPVILMCACKNYEQCHRKTIADKLKALGFSVEEIPRKSTTRYRQTTLL